MQAELFTWSYCPFCRRAKGVLDEAGIPYIEHVMDAEPERLEEVKRRYEHSTVPIVLIDGQFIGGCSELEAMARQGTLQG